MNSINNISKKMFLMLPAGIPLAEFLHNNCLKKMNGGFKCPLMLLTGWKKGSKILQI